MDFIERVFHISPDGGSGALELALLLVPVVVVVVFLLARHSKRARTRDQQCRRQVTLSPALGYGQNRIGKR
jgi:hypothetical protein